MTSSTLMHRAVAGVACGALLAAPATAGLLLGAAHASPGPAPAPVDHTVLAKVHTDAVATFLEEGRLVLGSTADAPEPATRYQPEAVWFHVDDASATTLPAGYEFVAPPGTPVWVTPEASPGGAQLWPGFSTEGVPAGAVEGTTRLQLDAVRGPGDVEVYTSGGAGVVQRLWSSDEDHKALDLPRTHRHANWAFTAAGTYELDVTARARIGGREASDTATYTFVVGDLPEAVATTTSLTASAPSVVSGDPVTLDATVAPASVEGHVEFRDGANVLGHEAVEDGAASLRVDGLGLGTRSLTAVFVPTASRTARGSTSAPVQVQVSDPSGVPFGIDGVRAGYQPGDVLEAHVVGHDLGEGESYLWLIRPVGVTTSSYVFAGTGDAAEAGRIEQVLDPSYDDYEISVVLQRGRTDLAESAWVPLQVANTAEPVAGAFPQGPVRVGDDIEITLRPRALADGEQLRLVYRGSYSPWFATDQLAEQVDEDTFAVYPMYGMTDVQWAVQVVADGLVVAQSAPFAGEIPEREALVEGIRGVYRVGQTLRATADVHPPREGLVYRWFTVDQETYEMETLQEGTDAAALTLELPMTMAYDDVPLYFAAEWDYGPHVSRTAMSVNVLQVSDTDPSTQLVFLEGISGHYHQGGPVNLRLVADPELADTDTVAWHWRWPGAQEWTPLPGASGMAHTLTAEQALDGVEVRATLTFASDGSRLATEPVTIHVDDHGAPARQVLTVDGGGSHTAGEGVRLSAALRAPSVLSRYQWQRRPAGGQEYVTVEGATGPELTFEADLGDDGAEYRVALLTPTGRVAYGPSAPVRLAVAAPPPVVNDAAPTVSGAPVVGETLTASAGRWTPEPDQVTYRWLADGNAVDGATGSSFVPGAAQVGSTVQVEVTASRSGHRRGVSVSAPTTPVVAGASPSTPLPGAPAPSTPPPSTPAPSTPAPGAPAPAAVAGTSTTIVVPAAGRVYGRATQVSVRVTPSADGPVSLRAGARTWRAHAHAGVATFTVPPRALAPGRHDLVASYAGASGRFLPSTGRAALRIRRAEATGRVTLLRSTARRLLLRVAVRADGVVPDGTVTLTVAGRSRTVRLDERGRARVTVPRPQRGTKDAGRVTLAYDGGRYVDGGRWSERIRWSARGPRGR